MQFFFRRGIFTRLRTSESQHSQLVQRISQRRLRTYPRSASECSFWKAHFSSTRPKSPPAGAMIGTSTSRPQPHKAVRLFTDRTNHSFFRSDLGTQRSRGVSIMRDSKLAQSRSLFALQAAITFESSEKYRKFPLSPPQTPLAFVKNTTPRSPFLRVRVFQPTNLLRAPPTAFIKSTSLICS